MEGMNFAAIDIGTNAARLLIKNIDHNQIGRNKVPESVVHPLSLASGNGCVLEG